MKKMIFNKDKKTIIKELEDKIEISEKLYRDTKDYSMIQYFKGHIQAYKESIKLIKQMK